MTRKALLTCGIISSLLYVAADVLAGLYHPGYHSYASITISELNALGSPTRPLVMPLLVLHGVLVIPFAIGLRQSAAGNRALWMAGTMMLVLGVINVAGTPFPIHVRGAAPTVNETMHIILTFATVVVFLVAMGFAAAAFGKGFRLYSIATIVVLVVFGALSGMQGPQIAANLPTPWVGAFERVNIGGYLLWQIVLALRVWRVPEPSTAARFSGTQRSSSRVQDTVAARR
jgi:hypothetical protein